MSLFKNDFKDRKRRFLRGLNALLENDELENKIIAIKNAMNVDVSEFRKRLAEFYCLEFTNKELAYLLDITTGDFTEKYVEVIYRDRGDFDFNNLIGSSIENINGEL